MFEVLKGSLTRRLVLLFMVLSIIPTLAVTIIPSILRVNKEKETLAALESNLEKNAEEKFYSIVETKALYYEQLLSARVNHIEFTVNTLAQSDYIAWNQISDLWFEHDASLDYFIVNQELNQTICFKREYYSGSCDEQITNNLVSNQGPYTVSSEIKFPNDRPYPQLVIHGIHNQFKISAAYDLEKILNEVPRVGIAPNSTLFFLDEQGKFLGYPTTWGDVPLLGKLNYPKSELIEKSAADIFPLQDTDLLSPSNLSKYRELQHSVVLPALFNGEKVFFAFQPIKDTPISVLIILPLSDVYQYASSYGASLSQIDFLSISIQIIFSTISFLLVIFFGALLTLRVIAEPIKTLHDGATAITQNQWDTRVPETGLGEIKYLATAFNQMSASIQSTQKDLQVKQQELEKTLTVRMEELSAMNGIIAFTNADLDLSQKLNGVIKILCETLEISNAKIYLYDAQGKLSLITVYDPLSQIRFDDCDFQEISINFKEQVLGKLLLVSNPENPINPIHIDFLQALSTTIGVLVKNAELQSQVRSITISEERRNLARELHDSVTQTLFSVSLAAQGLISALGEINNPAAKRALNLLTDQLSKVRSEMRGLILELRPIELENQNLEEAIQGHAASLQRTTAIKIKTEIIGDLDTLSYDIQTAINRIIQESLSNIARHARATKVEISLNYNNRGVELKIKDNGIGFDVKGAMNRKGSYGLINIRERSEIFGGAVEIESHVKLGTTVFVTIPIEANK